MMSKKILLISAILCCSMFFSSCGNKITAHTVKKDIKAYAKKEALLPEQDIDILITSNLNQIDSSAINAIGNIKKEMIASGKSVLLVDNGDMVSINDANLGLDRIALMNEAEYDLASYGDSDFVFGIQAMYNMTNSSLFPHVCCNFFKTTLDVDFSYFSSYQILDIAGVKVAFIGIVNPNIINEDNKVEFLNDRTGKFLYFFKGENNPYELYSEIQNKINEASLEADYVIGLCHMGDSIITSSEIKNNTVGLDAIIDEGNPNEYMTLTIGADGIISSPSWQSLQ